MSAQVLPGVRLPGVRGGQPAAVPRSGRFRILLAALLPLAAVSACSFPGLPGATGAPDARSAVVSDSPGHGDVADSPGHGDADAAGDDAPAISVQGGDLHQGSLTRRLPAAAHTLVIDYWTDRPPLEWTAASPPIIHLSARIDGPDDGASVRLTRFTARVEPQGTILAHDEGSFVVRPPFAYASGLVLPAGSSAARVVVTFDLLTETMPGSGDFTRQTVIDALMLGHMGAADDSTAES